MSRNISEYVSVQDATATASVITSVPRPASAAPFFATMHYRFETDEWYLPG